MRIDTAPITAKARKIGLNHQWILLPANGSSLGATSRKHQHPKNYSLALRPTMQIRATTQRDLYGCPAGKLPTCTRTLVNDGETLLYRASKYDCDACELKPRYCPEMPARKVPRSIHEGARDVARDIAKTDAYVTSPRERKKIKMLFAHLKRILRLDRLRLRGPCGARDEFFLAAPAQNLRNLANLIPLPVPSPA
jgi:hypothetical protein